MKWTKHLLPFYQSQAKQLYGRVYCKRLLEAWKKEMPPQDFRKLEGEIERGSTSQRSSGPAYRMSSGSEKAPHDSGAQDGSGAVCILPDLGRSFDSAEDRLGAQG